MNDKTTRLPACWPTVMRKARWKPMAEEQREFLAEREAEAITFDPVLKILRDRLVSFAGERVVLCLGDEDLYKILKRGELMVGGPHGGCPIMARGEPSRCHSNSAACWDANRDDLWLCTGYALSEDGIWRQHSWCWHVGKRRVVETTEARVAYYGYKMTPPESREFVESNY